MTAPQQALWRERVAEVALALPNMVKLLARLVRDPGVPRRAKLIAGVALAYTVSPIDLVPDFIPVIGVADDVLVAALAIDRLLTTAGEDLVTELWDGRSETLELIRAVVESAADLVPARIRWLLR
jgi:uncharacterized membrane protein YkvA (DUF1232 family)